IKYGPKFYSFNWDYFKKTETCLKFIQNSGELNLLYNSKQISGQGLGIKGDANFFMIYYTYQLF
ncbi:MAG: hypothetical protein ABL940_03490, partial [Bacteroidia bacterium]